MDIIGIFGYIVAPVSGAVAWFAGTRSRKNSVYQEMLETIRRLTEQNSDLQKKVCQLQDELIEVRRENAELKTGQAIMTVELQRLQAETEKRLNHIQ